MKPAHHFAGKKKPAGRRAVLRKNNVDKSIHLGAELIEIDENLCRSELTAAQRSKAVKRRREIWEALHPVMRAPVCDENNSGHSSPTIPERSAGRPKEFAAETAAVTGEAKRTINQHLARAEALGDDLDKVTGTSLDKGVELDALKAMTPDQRAPLIERAQAGEKVTARPETAHEAPVAASPVHTTTSLIAALQSTMQYLLDSTDCKTVDEAVQLICRTFGDQHEDDDALYAALDPFCVVGHLEPAGMRLVAA